MSSSFILDEKVEQFEDKNTNTKFSLESLRKNLRENEQKMDDLLEECSDLETQSFETVKEKLDLCEEVLKQVSKKKFFIKSFYSNSLFFTITICQEYLKKISSAQHKVGFNIIKINFDFTLLHLEELKYYIFYYLALFFLEFMGGKSPKRRFI